MFHIAKVCSDIERRHCVNIHTTSMKQLCCQTSFKCYVKVQTFCMVKRGRIQTVAKTWALYSLVLLNICIMIRRQSHPDIRLDIIQGAEAKSALYKNGYDAFKNRLFCLKLYTYVAYCIVLDVNTAKSRYNWRRTCRRWFAWPSSAACALEGVFQKF